MGLVGTFDIPSIFGGTGSVNYGLVGSTFSATNEPVDITCLRRLELFHIGSQECMAMVGDASYSELTIHPVVSAYLAGGTWYYGSDLQKNDIIFTDITCLDQLIVATGTFMDKPFAKTFWPMADFHNHECISNNIHYFTHGLEEPNPPQSPQMVVNQILPFLPPSLMYL